MADEKKSVAPKAAPAELRATISSAPVAMVRRTAHAWANEKRIAEWLVRGAEAIAKQQARMVARDGAPIPEFRTTEMTEVEFDAAIDRAR